MRSALRLVSILACLAAAPAGAREGYTADSFMVAAAHPLAVEAGYEVLKDGGSAADAAVAVQMVLTLVEPQSSGIGGGGYLLYWDAKSRTLTSYDGRERAPLSMSPKVFLGPDGRPLKRASTRIGAAFAGVPGIPALMGAVHRDHGRLIWSSLFAAAIRDAETGFEVTPHFNKQIVATERTLRQMPGTYRYFFDRNGLPLPIGTIRTNPALADTFRALAAGGPEAFYEGPLAREIVTAVHSAPIRPGGIELADLAGYQIEIRDNLCAPYREYTVCSMGPSSSGGHTVLETLGILESFDLASLRPGSAAAIHLISEAQKIAYADRGRYAGDPAFVPVPVTSLLDEAYLAARAATIDPQRASGPAEPGAPDGVSPEALKFIPEPSLGGEQTSHMSIVDGEGNALSFTTSIEAAFGSHVMVGGYLLNNQLRDFAAIPQAQGHPVANGVAPGKRPRSSMSPTIVFGPDGAPKFVVGSPGGGFIIGYVTQTLVGLIDWDLSMQAAIDLPHHIHINSEALIVEKGQMPPTVKAELERMGHTLAEYTMMSGLQGITMHADHLEGGADRRREGAVMGD